MSDERWIVTHATESGATRMWWVDASVADALTRAVFRNFASHARDCHMLYFHTLTGRALIWLTPGQSLTVEKSNG